MTFALVFLVNAGLSFALSLVVAAFVGPEVFGRYALALSGSVVIATACFEWLRLSATRFYSESVRVADPAIRSTLDAAYAVLTAILVAATLVVLAAGWDVGLSPGLAAAAVGAGLAAGWFDYRVALARARFLDRPYAALLLTRGILGFALAATLAAVFADPAIVLVGSAGAALVAIAVLRRRLGDPGAQPTGARAAHLATFARYALPLVAASALYQLLPLINRGLVASRSGFEEAGYFALTGEIAMRLFQNLGSALDIVLFQLAVRAEEVHGRAEAERRIGRNAGIVAALTLPSAAGLCLAWPSFEALFIPASFRGHLGPLVPLIVPAIAAYALIQYALNPVFQLRRRTGPVILAAAVGIAVDLAFAGYAPGSGPEHVAAAQLAGLGAAMAVLTVLAALSGAALPVRDVAGALAACGVMAAAMWPTRTLQAGATTLALQVALGVAVYGAAALVLGIAGSRQAARRLAAAARTRWN